MKYLVLSVLLVSCSLFEEPQVESSASKLPLLIVDQGVGYMLGFELYSASVQDSIKQAEQDLLDAGLKVARIQIDWPELEIAKGTYQMDRLIEPLQENQFRGLQTFLTISVYDSDGPVLPDYLGDADVDDSELQNRFNLLMDRVIPILAENGGYALAIANEPDNYYAENDLLDNQILRFVKKSIEHIHQLNPEMGVSVTINIENRKHSAKKIDRLVEACDFLSINIYAAGPILFENGYSIRENEELLEEMMDLADGKQVVVQEFGIPTDNEILLSNEYFQMQYYDQFFEFMRKEKDIRVAYQFTLMDWSDWLVNEFNKAFEGEDIPEIFIEQYGTILNSLGLLDVETGARKKGFQTFLEGVSEFR